MIAIGVQTWGTDVHALRRYWRRADELGYTRLTYGDGLGDWTHDGWTMLAAMALVTRRARIGPAITYGFDPSSHHPSWLAKRAVTIDHLSGGRLDLRLGVGHHVGSGLWNAHGIDYPTGRQRVARLEETVTIVRRLWTGDAVNLSGRFYTVRGARLMPRPLQPWGPPVWVAAMRPRALALAARVADGWEASYLSPAAFAARWRDVARRLGHGGRSAESLRRSVETDIVIARSADGLASWLARFRAERGIRAGHRLHATALIGTPAAIRAQVQRFARAGATDLMLGFADFPETGMLDLFARTVLRRRGTVGRRSRRPR